MRSTAAVVSLVFVLVPRLLAAQSPGGERDGLRTGEPRPQKFSLHAAAGSTTRGGDVQSASMGYSPWEGLTLLVGGERSHLPTRVRHYSGGFGASRGAMLLMVSGELQVSRRFSRRASAYAAVGAGLGVSHPNVNELFRDRVSNGLLVGTCGAGVSVQAGRSLSVFADARLALGRERDVLITSLPLRGGVAWRF